MSKSVLLIICSIFTISLFNSLHPAQSEQSHRQWLQDRYLEAVSIKEGMSRADLLKLFEMDGGLQLMLPERYVLKSCTMIKVDIKFDIPNETKNTIIPEDLRFEMASPTVDLEGKPSSTKKDLQFVPDEKLKIKTVSRPYLEPEVMD
ncbi:MAG: hypothetical protein QOH63_3378 [Acidobacteriota bacterium]|nr:hypothetical protein [Acidobacteriota bacterium]